MTAKLYGFCGALIIAGACYSGSVKAADKDTEEVTVEAPYTIHQKTLTRNLSGLTEEAQITVESSVSYADLDFSKQADVDTMRDRLRNAARDSCRKVESPIPPFGYIPVREANCVRTTTLQSFAQLDEIRASASWYARRQSAKN